MAKFAKLFDVADTQVLVQVTDDSEGDASIKFSTKLNGLNVSTALSFGDEPDAWDRADQALEKVDQEMANGFHLDMLDKFGEGIVKGLLKK